MANLNYAPVCLLEPKLNIFILFCYAYVSVKSIDCIFLSTFELKAILLVSSINKQQLQHIAFNHSSDIGFQDCTNLYKNVLQNHVLF